MPSGGGQGGNRRFGRRGFGRARRAPDDPDSVEAARGRAIGLLSRRDLPADALRGRLTDAGFATAAADGAVEELIDERLVNDARYVESAVASRTARGQGPVRITLELKRLGLAPELVTAAVDARHPDWLERAVELRVRRFGAAPPSDGRERARQARFLLYRGFTGEHLRAAFGAAADDVDLDLEAIEGYSDPDAG